ncbi:MAG: T9SS type A sorting domain-containing protein [Cyclobacteriaceae bacterium]
MRKIVYYILILMCLPLARSLAQTEQIRSGTSQGAGWKSAGPYTTFGVAGQSSIATQVGGGEYNGSVGFVFSPVIPEVNEPPLAIGTPDRLFYQVGDVYTLEAFDPEGEQLIYEIVDQTQFGSVVVNVSDESEVSFVPNVGLTPGELYHDSFTFKVTEDTENGLSSETALIQFSFILSDKPHEIVSLTKTGADFELVWDDSFVNNAYNVQLEYYDVETSSFISAASATVDNTLYNVADSNTLDYTLSVDPNPHPYLFNGDRVFITLEITSEGGFSDAEAYVLDNTDPAEPKVLASSDGLFFAFGSEQTVPENNEVTLQMSAVELGEFDVSQATIQLLSTPVNGTLTQPVLVKVTDNLLTWESTYTSTGDIGGLEEIEFSIFHPARDVTESSSASVDVIAVNDPPSLAEIFDQQMVEDGSLDVTLNAYDPDSELHYSAVGHSNADKVNLSFDGNILTIDPIANYSGLVSISAVVNESGNNEGDNENDNLSDSQLFWVEIIAQNDSPVLEPVENESANEDETVQILLSASDEDDNVLIFDYLASVSDPSIADVEIIGSELSVIPVDNASGLVTVTVSADDRSGSDNSESSPIEFTVDFNPVNDRPEIIQELSDQVLVENFPGYEIDLSAYFDDVETAVTDLDFSVSGNTDVLISFTNATMNVTTTAEYFGQETVTITASDGSLEASMEVEFKVNELGANIIVANPINDFMLNEDFDTFEIDVSDVFQDSNDVNAIFDYELSGNNFVITSVDDVNEKLTISSAENVSEDETLILVGTTGDQASFVEFDLLLTSVNDAPILDEIENESIFEDGELANLLLETSDVDHTIDQLDVSAVSNNQEVIRDEDISINFVDGFYYLSTAPLANVSGTADITIMVTDGDLDAEQTFVLSILSVNDEPTVLNVTLADGIEDVEYSADISTLFEDIDEDVLTYEIANLPDWLTQSGASISGTPENGDTGEIALQIVASDGNGGSVQESFDFSIVAVNDIPKFSDISDQSIDEDTKLSDLFIDVSDIDDAFGDLTFTASSSDQAIVPNANIEISTTGGFLTISVTPLENQYGDVDISVRASDGSLSGETTFSLAIVGINDGPEVSELSVQSIDEDAQLSDLAITVTDLDNSVDDLTYTATSSDQDLLTDENIEISSIDGIVTISASPTANLSGSVEITVTASDGVLSAEQTFTLEIAAVNDAPIVLEDGTELIATEDEAFTYSIVDLFDDVDDEILIFELGSHPDWMTLTDGILSGTPTNGHILSMAGIDIIASDGNGGSVTGFYFITVENVNDAPVLTNASENVITKQNSAYSYSIPSDVFTDIDQGDNLTLEIVSHPDWLTLADGVLTGTPGYAEIGTYTIEIKATDVAGEEVTDSFELEVEFVVYDVPFTASNAAGCSGESIIVEADGAIDYNWYDKDSNLLQTGGTSLELTAEIEGQVIIEAKDAQDRANPEKLTYDLVVTASPDAPTVTEEAEELSIPEVAGLTYQWYLNDVAISGSAATAASFTPDESGEYYALVTNAAGCTAASNVVEFSKVLGLSFNDNTLKMYPVPVKSDLVLQSDLDLSKYNFDITDMNGKLLPVRSRRTLNSVIFDVSELANGVYIMRVHKEGELAIRRFIKE